MPYNPKTWNYDRPINLWESWPWWRRWIIAFLMLIALIVAIIIPVAAIYAHPGSAKDAYLIWWPIDPKPFQSDLITSPKAV